MMDEKKSLARKVCLWLGVGLIVFAAIALILWNWNIYSSENKSQKIVEAISALVPEAAGAVPEERSDNAMPVLSVDGTDFVGVIEMPRYGSSLPICNKWGSVTKYPCRFNGSIYDGSLVIGATSQKGEYDFYREISVGDTVVLTDMEGNRYTLAVTDLRYENSADETALKRNDSLLTLFIKNVYGFDYLVVSCDLPK